MREDVTNNGCTSGDRLNQMAVFTKLTDTIARRSAKKMRLIVQLGREDTGRPALDEQGQDALKVRSGARRRSRATRGASLSYFRQCRGRNFRLYWIPIGVSVAHKFGSSFPARSTSPDVPGLLLDPKTIGTYQNMERNKKKHLVIWHTRAYPELGGEVWKRRRDLTGRRSG